jgi:hypothetical protein
MNAPQGIRSSAIPSRTAAYRPAARNRVQCYALGLCRFSFLSPPLIPHRPQKIEIIPHIGVIGIKL